MRLITPDNLHYPITVIRLLRKADDTVFNGDPLFDYEYRTTVIEGTEEHKEGIPVEKKFTSTFQSHVDGKLEKWLVKPSMVIVRSRTPLADIEEPCRHEVQFGGICADCGKDMTTVDYNTATRDTARATVNTVHGHTELLVSAAEASRSDEEAKRRLLSSRRLSLVVDLDQTIIHATVDPTVGEWQNDTSNPNYESVKDVRAFQLADDTPGTRGCWYYIKLRPGLQEFFDIVSKVYECHIYTMGTRAYARHIANIVDPHRKIFGDRILSRDESGSMTVKSLKRLFPVDTKMVVIIDDRGDVWHWSQNLIKVTPYDFFVGIGDINSSFLPKRPGIDIPSLPKIDVTAGKNRQVDAPASTDSAISPSSPVINPPVEREPQADANVSAIEQLMSMGGSNDAAKLQEQTEAQDETIAAQLTDRPLMQKQKMLDAHDEAVANDHRPTTERPEEYAADRPRHNLLEDRDTELGYLQQSLCRVHSQFFEEYDRRMEGAQRGRISELRPEQADKRAIDNLDDLPDVTTIMAGMKQRVLQGVHIVFTGVVPLGIRIHAHDLAIWAESFGASVSDNISKRTTHVIAAPSRRTAKVRQAARSRSRISIVSQQWLFDCVSRWQHVPEEAYKIHSDIPEEEARSQHESESTLLGGPPPEHGVLSSSEDDEPFTEEDGEAANALSVRTRIDGTEDGDTDVELQKYMPSLPRADRSPQEGSVEDWDGMNDELAEFLGSDDDDDDDDDEDEKEDYRDAENGSTTETEGTEIDHSSSNNKVAGVQQRPGPRLKRKRTGTSSKSVSKDDEDDNDDSEADSDLLGGSELQRRKRKALARSTTLTESMAAADVVAVESLENTVVGVKSMAEDKDKGIDDDDDADDDGDDLEAELEAEMARQASEEEQKEEEAKGRGGGGGGGGGAEETSG